jgi:hypothetical protein
MIFVASKNGRTVKIYASGGAYYVPYSCLLISNKFCNGGGGGRAQAGRTSSFMILLLHPLSMGPETSLVGSCTQNHLCTYDLYIPVHNVLNACISITWGSRRGLGPEILEFSSSLWICTHPKHYARGCINHRCLNSYFPPSSLGAVVGSRTDKNQDPGSGINIPDPQHWYLS